MASKPNTFLKAARQRLTPWLVPLVLLVHGGPWGRDDYGYSGYDQWLANRGYAVLQVNFRGSGGYGQDFEAAGYRQWGGAMINDLLDWSRDTGILTFVFEAFDEPWKQSDDKWGLFNVQRQARFVI